MPDVWVISDGVAGMRFQSLALAEAMGWTAASGFHDIIAAPRQPLRSLPHLGRIPMLASLLPISTPPLPLADNGFPDILVTCGRRMAGISIAIRQRARASGHHMKTIHIQDPRLDPACFDILLVPAHDPARGSNVIVSTGSLNRLTPDAIADAARTLDAKWIKAGFPRVAVMLGGDNRRYRISPKMARHMALKLARFATHTNASLAVVPSRRTPPDLIRHLTETLMIDTLAINSQSSHQIATPQDTNPYPGILGVADAIIVTSDSVNMASEATITGKPVMIAGWKDDTGLGNTGHGDTGHGDTGHGETGRLAAFHDAMMQGGHTMPLGDNIRDHNVTPLDEMPAICTQVKILLERG